MRRSRILTKESSASSSQPSAAVERLLPDELLADIAQQIPVTGQVTAGKNEAQSRLVTLHDRDEAFVCDDASDGAQWQKIDSSCFGPMYKPMRRYNH